ncbi:MAG: Na+/H+ antiporter NhaA [Micrococcales bacterium]
MARSNGWLASASKRQVVWLSRALRNETTGGILLLLAASSALIWINLDRSSFSQLRDFQIGPSQWHLDLSLGKWAADGLLAIFFFVAGIELKHELVEGSLKDKRVAAVPIAAALGGMLAPALIFLSLNAGTTGQRGWGIPMATDIAFALAVLAVAGRRLPIELRAFLLTLAVVDDLGAIIVIAIFYTAKLNLLALAIALGGLFIFGMLQKKRVTGWYFYLPLAAVIWAATHESGIHATVAGVAMGLLMNLKQTDRVLNIVHPISAGFAVPVFAFFSAGVLIDATSFEKLTSEPVALGIALGLLLGKPIGVVGTAWLVSRFTRASLSKALSWWDVAAIGVLAGIGFTVSLLINELAFKGQEVAELGTLAVLTASTIAAVLAIIALSIRKRAHAQPR